MVNLNYIVTTVIALVVIGALASVGISSINNANTTGWTDTQVLLFGLIGTFFVIGLLLAFIPKFKGRD
jgi:Na+-transporting NADH:ubiquinone oxidoreductase subunit NqrD